MQPSRTTTSDGDVELLDAAWDEFFAALRRAKGRAAARHAEGELTLAQMQLLAPLASGPTRVGEIADAAGVSAPTASRTLDGLERDGLVSRVAADEDRRATAVELTERGRELYEQRLAEHRAKRREVFAGLSPEEREQAAHLLRRIAGLVDEL